MSSSRVRDAIALAIVLVFCALYFLDRARTRGSAEGALLSARRDVAELLGWLAGELRRTDSAIRRLSERVQSLADIASAAPRPEGPRAREPGALESPSTEALVAPVEEEALPPLPDGISDPVAFTRGLELEGFFADPRFNPGGRALAPTEKLRAGCQTVIARDRIDILDKEIQMLCSEHVEEMRARGEYVEYEKGQRPDPAPAGTVTFGEVTDRGSMRLYAFPPEDEAFAAIYERRDAQGEIGEELVRRLVKLAQPEAVAAGTAAAGAGSR